MPPLAHTHAPHAAGHDHADVRTLNRRRLLIALCLALGYAVVELVGGWLTGSLALLADARGAEAPVLAVLLRRRLL